MTARSITGSSQEPSIARRLVGEAFGTFALVFVAVGGDAAGRITGGQVDVAARAVAPALMVAALIYAIGDTSGAHFNPVVTLAFFSKRLFPGSLVPAYWLAQVGGALLAALLVAGMFGSAVEAGVSTPHVGAQTAVVLEAILTLLLVTVILGTADRARVVGPNAALAVGATIGLCGLIALPLDGASMNPARSLGPALVTGRIEDVWVYVVGPFAGAVLAVLLTAFLHGHTERDPTSREAAQGGD